MDQAALSTLLAQLVSNWEDEVVEFKRGKENYSSSQLGQYVSALANEANLRGRERAWLVFGIDNDTRTVVGTTYKPDPAHLQADKMQIINGTGSFTVRDIHVLNHEGGRVIFFEIPAAPRGIPIGWNGHYYGRAGESLVALGQDKLDEIRAQTLGADWTAQLVDGATIDDLDPQALQVARDRFAAKHANRVSPDEVATWSEVVFLDRAKLTQGGQITRAALLLLGKAQSASKLNPHPAEITWRLEGEERAYEHFGPPFLLTSSQVYARIRNIQLRLLPENELLPHEVAKYDQKVVLEALHNCIAHQDYASLARIVVTERQDRLIFENDGAFFEGQPDDYVLGDRVPRRYRNPFLINAMTELNMIDHMGYGIQDIYRRQRERFLPLPDYDLSQPNVVRLTIHGRVVDPAYSQLLMQQTGLPLADVLALDRVQKHLPITDDAVRHLRQKHLIEGRKPRFFISAKVADATLQKALYIKMRSFDDYHYEEMIVGYLREFGQASRKELDELLRDKIGGALDEVQKTNKIGNLLSALRRKGRIRNFGSKAVPQWRLVE